MTTNTPIDAETLARLEVLIDTHSLAAVLEALADVCADKAAHIEEAWQDDALATRWHLQSEKLEAASLAAGRRQL